MSRIETIEVIPLRVGGADVEDCDGTVDTVVVLLTDDAGRTGIGECDASPEAVKAFQEICRDVIRFRERRSQPDIRTALDLVLHAEGKDAHLTEKEAQRLQGHIVTLQNAEVPLKRVVVKRD